MFCESRSQPIKEKTDVNKKLVGTLLNRFESLIQNSKYTFATRVLITLCYPFELTKELVYFSIEQKMGFHVTIKYEELSKLK